MKETYLANSPKKGGHSRRTGAAAAGAHERTHEVLIDATLRIFAPAIEIEAIKPKVFCRRLDQNGAGRPATSPSRMLVQRVLDNDRRLLRLMTKRVEMALRHHVDAGLVVSHEGPGAL